MKIKSIDVETDLGHRHIQLSMPIEVDPTREMPAQFRSLIDLLWNVMCQTALHATELAAAAPKAEA